MDIIRVGDLTMNDLDMDDDGDLDSDDQAYLYIINTWNFAAVRNLTSLMNFFLANYCCIIYNLII
ncbi:hypothetical protein [Pseudobacteroides cellulosolvens]|uniref:Uncharacterized protein n=1 Tax=Pseudobacteroides cellulosolvens ATCC 35603 = DSM 2933 TaxID=398512 RepID=A0A0L6JR76_9FIRM|nr:hypothetical protein [Pseudobacteroides cellulosolvens]KNY28289.1 hypothetical protein Bccel_3563 [Pseudobacteroides cellulosolvens ATCC 35603 = DSM 2933]